MNIKIVTAFFDIGRGDFSNLSRSNDKYFDFFKFWARIQNDLTIYCQPQNVDRIKKIRADFGLENKTHVIAIDDYKSIEAEIYKRMTEIEANSKFKEFRYFYNALSNKADYCYIMLLKFWFLYNAAQKENSDQMMAWLDFGYNHGGELYTNPLNFAFEWDYEFENKINQFCLCDPDKANSINHLQFQADCFIGHTIVMPAKFCELYWAEIKQSIIALISLDCIDDDQQLELMVYKKHPEWFKIRICNWFEDLKMCSNQYFEVKQNNNRLSVKNSLKNVISKARRKKSFILRTIDRYQEYGR